MKKIALLLGALSLVSGAAYAKEVVPVVEEVTAIEEVAPVTAPTLTVTYVGQGLEIDNTSGAENIGESVMFSNSVGLAYGDKWTFDLMARKGWSMDTDDGIHSDNYRIDLGVWRNFDNYSLGFMWRQEQDMDRYYLRTTYEYGMFSGWIDAAYQSNNGTSHHEDAYYIEAIPAQLTLGPVTIGYYFEADTWSLNAISENGLSGDEVGDLAGFEHKYRQQLRLGFPLYQGEKLNLGFEYRWQFDTDVEYDTDIKKDAWVEENSNTHIIYLSADYAVTENLSISGYYQYDMKEYDSKNGKVDNIDSDRYYGEFFVGWTYTF